MKRETELLFQAIVMAIFVTGWNKRYNSPVETVAKSYFRCRRDERGLDGDGSLVALVDEACKENFMFAFIRTHDRHEVTKTRATQREFWARLDYCYFGHGDEGVDLFQFIALILGSRELSSQPIQATSRVLLLCVSHLNSQEKYIWNPDSHVVPASSPFIGFIRFHLEITGKLGLTGVPLPI